MTRKRERLAQRRKMAGYSQEQLAEVLRVERSTVVRWERGETAPVRHVAAAYEREPSASLLADAGQCHATVEWLLTQTRREVDWVDLHAAATSSATLMSQLVWDASQRRDYDTTVAYCDVAIEHAREHGDAVTAAHAELRKSFAALYGQADVREPRTGLAAAQSAAQQSRGVSNALAGHCFVARG